MSRTKACESRSAAVQRLERQYLYFCTSKASKACESRSAAVQRLERQYLYFCTSKASK
jgi:hypothetical protein